MDFWTIYLIIFCVAIFVCIVVGIAVSSNKKAKLREKWRQMDEKHNANLYYLYNIGFRIEEQYHPVTHSIYLYYDYTNKNVALEYYAPKQICSDVILFPLNRIAGCELVQNGSVVSREEGKIGGAVILGYGAMAGNKQSFSEEMGGVLAVRLVIDDMRVPSVTINVLEGSISKASQEYQKYYFIAQEVYGRFQGIVRINNAEREQSAQRKAVEQAPKAAQLPENIMDQLRKLAQLKDEGILTEQEFSTKKQLLMEKLT